MIQRIKYGQLNVMETVFPSKPVNGPLFRQRREARSLYELTDHHRGCEAARVLLLQEALGMASALMEPRGAAAMLETEEKQTCASKG